MGSLIKSSGLVTFRNNLGGPEGALDVGTNIVIDEPGVIEPRRGMAEWGTVANSTLKQLLSYKSRILKHFGTTLAFDSNGSGDFANGVFNGSYSEVDTGLRIKSVESNGNFYFTTSEGIKKISATSASGFSTSANYITNAGGLKALYFTLQANGTTGWLEDKFQVAYRLVWIKRDANDNVIYGPPSTRVVYENVTGSPTDIKIIPQLPSGVTTDHFLQIYRTAAYDNTATPGVDNCGDEMQLVSEIQYGSLSPFYPIDTTLEDFRAKGAYLYTNQVSGQGILQANEAPPIAKDLTLFRNRVFYANTKTVHRYSINLLTATGLNGCIFAVGNGTVVNKYTFQNYDLRATTLTVATSKVGLVAHGYSNTQVVQFSSILGTTGIVAGKNYYIINKGTDDFQISETVGGSAVIFGGVDGTADILADPSVVSVDGGIIGADQSGSPAQNIDTTARNLVRIINGKATSPVYAYYDSTADTLPGLINFENKTLADTKTYFCVDNLAIAAKFDPTLDVFASPTTVNIVTSKNYSDNDVAINRIYYSKESQPEAVPIVNYFDVGSGNKAIYRILTLRDSVVVLKEDGVYLVTGATEPFSSRLLDNSAAIIAPDSAAVLNNKVYCLSTQGVIAISEVGIDIVSRNIENLIKNATKSGMSYLHTTCAVGYEVDRSYLIALPSIISDTQATQLLRYNIFTDCWSKFDMGATCLLVHPTEFRLYSGDTTTNYILRERKDNLRSDYADKEFTKAMRATSPLNNTTIYMSSVSGIAIGDAAYQTQYVTISVVNQLLRKLDLDTGLALSAINGGQGYSATLEMNAGDNLQTKLQALDTMLQSDANIGTYVPIVFSASFATIQTEFNGLITQLNSGLVGTALKNYKESTGSVYYEAVVTDVNPRNNTLTINQEMPFIYGSSDPLTIYKGFECEVVWSPQHFGAIEAIKQIPWATFLFDNNNFYAAKFAFRSDLDMEFDEIDMYGSGTGDFGLMTFGQGDFGGQGANWPCRCLVPRNKQKSRYLTPRFRHINARNHFRLLGITMTPRVISDNPTSTRGYR